VLRSLRARGGLAERLSLSTKLGSLGRIPCLPQRIVPSSLVTCCWIAISTTLARRVVIWAAWISTSPSVARYAVYSLLLLEIRVAYLKLLGASCKPRRAAYIHHTWIHFA
jgi:hypothetical protein